FAAEGQKTILVIGTNRPPTGDGMARLENARLRARSRARAKEQTSIDKELSAPAPEQRRALALAVVARAEFEPEWCALEAELGAEGVLEVANVAEVHQPRVVAEQCESRRGRSGLGGVVDFERSPALGEGMRLDRLAYDVVEPRRRYAPGALCLDRQRLGNGPLDPLTRLGRHVHDRRPAGKFELAPQRQRVFLLRLGVFFDQVPLVDRHDQPFGRLLYVACDVRVLRQDALGRIDEQDRDIGPLDSAHCAQDAELLDAR